MESVEKLCNGLRLPDLYVAYMIESAYLHPSADGADVYLEVNGDGRIRLRHTSSVEGPPIKLFAALALLGSLAFASLTVGEAAKVLRALVEAEAQRLHVDITLDPPNEG